MVCEYEITATIVLYNEDLQVLKKTVDSFLKIPLKKRLFLVDNSPTNCLKAYFNQEEIVYIYTGKNLGFGKAHNLVLDKVSSPYHLLLNPDVIFNKEVIPALVKQLEVHAEVAFTTPKVLYPNGEIQYVCRKHPTIYDLLNRRISFSKKAICKNEYRNQDLTKSFFPDFIHGCFMLFKTADFKKISGFDERYFLYMEDADLSRKVDAIGKKKLFYPEVSITHQHQRGSANSSQLLYYHISSAIKYFLKWGF